MKAAKKRPINKLKDWMCCRAFLWPTSRVRSAVKNLCIMKIITEHKSFGWFATYFPFLLLTVTTPFLSSQSEPQHEIGNIDYGFGGRKTSTSRARIQSHIYIEN